jgi:DNA-directed RNA polymerase subunit RPC12/RpoP
MIRSYQYLFTEDTMTDIVCTNCQSNNIGLSKSFLGFTKCRCKDCSHKDIYKLSTRREVTYILLLSVLLCSIGVYYFDTLDAGALTYNDVISPFFIYIFVFSIAFALSRNQFLKRLPQKQIAVTHKSIPSLKKTFIALALLSLLTSVFFFEPSKEIAPLEVKEQDVKWHLFDKTGLPVQITLYVKNVSTNKVSGNGVFSLTLDNDKLGPQIFNFIDKNNLINTILSDFKDADNPRTQALINYYERGGEFENNRNYEQFSVKKFESESIRFSGKINLDPQEVTKLFFHRRAAEFA